MLRLRRKAAINARIASIERQLPAASEPARAMLARERRKLQAAKAALAAPVVNGCDDVCQACAALAL